MQQKNAYGFLAGVIIGTLGGLIGLGGAEFRLPLLIGFFGFPALEAVILNKAMSLVVVASALPFRAGAVSWSLLAENWQIVMNLLAGSLLGAWTGAGWATKLRSKGLYKIIAILLVVIAAIMISSHMMEGAGRPMLENALLLALSGAVAGFAIGVVAALLGVAGGELLIPTLVILFGVDIKLAGSLSLAVSLPTMLVSFTRYSRDRSFSVLGANKPFLFLIAAGSIAGTWIGGRLLGVVSETVLIPMLVLLLLLSALKVWKHQ
ncbi:MAG: permease [Pelodictyon luteolum]|uniref:Probable membrane transporter protein n=1 Tax=Pelodictyon luteolum TaxID=1100 RepID=A0A165LZP9_PELLU|nr:sulfite exporter TauE/SafE family protein [Pelodictyon luteolum]KZK74626.1 MAG: permease [Pelodictyon luteolum]